MTSPDIPPHSPRAARYQTAGETTPCLALTHSRTDAEENSYGDENHPRRRGREKRQQLYILAIFIILIDFGGFLAIAPQTEIFTQIACEEYYRRDRFETGAGADAGIDGRSCNIDPVTSEVALVNGWKDTFDQVPGILLAIPYGILADRIGRKPVLLLGQLGHLMQDVLVKVICWWPSIFSLRLVWVSSILQAIGGGSQVVSSMVFVIVADTFAEKDRANAFFRLYAAILVSEIIATPISAALMTKSPWLPYAISLGTQIVAAVVNLFFLPESLQKALESAPTAEVSENSTTEMRSTQKPLKLHAINLRSVLKSSTQFMFNNANIMLLLFVFFVASLGRQAMQLLLLYVAKKFGWSFARASFLISLRGAVNLVLLLVILPLLTHLLRQRYFLTAPTRDLLLSKTSSIFLTLGSLILFLSSTVLSLNIGVIIFALGSSFYLTARSLVTSLVLPTHVGTLYTAIAVMTGAGTLIAGPGLAEAFRWGIRIGEGWEGLPYLVAGALFFTAAAAVWSVRLPRGDLEAEGEIAPGDEGESEPFIPAVDVAPRTLQTN